MIVWLQVVVANAATIVVAQDGTGDFTTLTEGLWAAMPGDTVIARSGVYTPLTGESFPLQFTDGVNLKGMGRDETVIDASGSAFGTISGSNTMSDLTLSGGWPSASSSSRFGALQVTRRGRLTMDHARFAANGSALVADGWVDLDDVEFIDNQPAFGEVGGLNATCGYARRLVVRDAGNGGLRLLPFGDDDCQWGVLDASFVRGPVYTTTSVTNSVVVSGSATRTGGACIYTTEAHHNAVVGCAAEFAVAAEVANSNVVVGSSGLAIEATLASSNVTWNNAGGDWGSIDHTGTLYNLAADPRFRAFSDDGDWTNDDLRLADDSPAIDAASSDFPPYDFDGVPRPQDGDGDGVARADIGPFEWGLLDHDKDGWFVEDDCDDDDPAIHPAARDLPYNGVDEDCDGHDLIDADGDGFDADHQGGDDCDDTEPAINPGAWDTPEDGVDQDCDGLDPRDDDDDGWPATLDCDDADPEIFPTQIERCDGIDQDCDDRIDDDCVDEDRIGGCCGRSDDASLWVLGPLVLLARRRRRR